MSVLLRVAMALLIAVPVFVVLLIVFVLAGRRADPRPRERGNSPALARGAWVGPSLAASQVTVEVSRQ
jgi:heme/copper-type cytochrome/quinol oxidase subunit 2